MFLFFKKKLKYIFLRKVFCIYNACYHTNFDFNLLHADNIIVLFIFAVRTLIYNLFVTTFGQLHKSLKLCRYNPTIHSSPFVYIFNYLLIHIFAMLLDELFWIQEYSIFPVSFRRSCREGICGSCAMNINGTNTLACIYALTTNLNINIVYPLAHLPIIRDLVVSLKHFYNQYKSIQPWIHISSSEYKNIIQYHNQRILLDGLYECILCACCSTSCPSYWWNSNNYLGPAILLQAYRWVVDSRDISTLDRILTLNDTFKLYRCHSIMNCTQSCPKGINPARAIGSLKKLLQNLLHINVS